MSALPKKARNTGQPPIFRAFLQKINAEFNEKEGLQMKRNRHTLLFFLFGAGTYASLELLSRGRTYFSMDSIRQRGTLAEFRQAIADTAARRKTEKRQKHGVKN